MDQNPLFEFRIVIYLRVRLHFSEHLIRIIIVAYINQKNVLNCFLTDLFVFLGGLLRIRIYPKISADCRPYYK